MGIEIKKLIDEGKPNKEICDILKIKLSDIYIF
jgi:DNA-binding CsgD family transcriptional regulator